MPPASGGLLAGDDAQAFVRTLAGLSGGLGVGRVDGVEAEDGDVHSRNHLR